MNEEREKCRSSEGRGRGEGKRSTVFKLLITQVREDSITFGRHRAGVKLEARDRNGRLGFSPTVDTADNNASCLRVDVCAHHLAVCSARDKAPRFRSEKRRDFAPLKIPPRDD